MQRFHHGLRWLLPVAAIVTAATASAVGTRHFVIDGGSDFKGGDLKGVAVDDLGTVRPGLDLGRLEVTKAKVVWTSYRKADGSVLLGTGNEGKVLQLKGGKETLVVEAKKLLVVTSIVELGGKLLIAGLGEGVIYEVANGKTKEFAKLDDAENVFAMASDGRGAVYVATGPKGKLYRVDRTGKAQVHYDAEEPHIMSVATASPTSVYFGTSGDAKLYKATGPGRATVVHDFDRTEVRAIALGKGGAVFAVANKISGGSSVRARISLLRRAAGKKKKPRGGSGSGVLYRFAPDGTPEELMSESSEHFVSLTVVDGTPYVGTGKKGRIFSVDDTHNSVLIADTEARQVVGLHLPGALGSRGQYVVGSDPAVYQPVRGLGGADAVWTSKVLDAGIRARFGRMSWIADGTVALSTRSGNTSKPDDTWSAWSSDSTASTPVASPAARYLQVRARFKGDKSAVLRSIEIPFVTDNLRAIVKKVDAKSPADASGSSGVSKSGGPMSGKPSTTIKLSWSVDNPDKDELRYRVHYRLVGTTTWLDLLEPNEKLTSTSKSWDTSGLPEGKYRIRVTASDDLANPPGKVTSHQLTSPVVLVDNSPPELQRLRVVGRRVQATAVDGVGPIARVEVAIAGQDVWHPYFPKDGIFDTAREALDMDVSSFASKAGTLLVVRAYDRANNRVVRSVLLK